jgi:dihydrofolate reductase
MIKIIITTDIDGTIIPLEEITEDMYGNIIILDHTLYNLLMLEELSKCRSRVIYSDNILVDTPSLIYSTDIDKLLRDYYRYCSDVDFMVLGGKELFEAMLERDETCEINLKILNKEVEGEEQLDVNAIINSSKNTKYTMDVLDDGTEVYTIEREKQ